MTLSALLGYDEAFEVSLDYLPYDEVDFAYLVASDLHAETMQNLTASIGNLYDLLPVIRAIRRQHMLRTETVEQAWSMKSSDVALVIAEDPLAELSRQAPSERTPLKLVDRAVAIASGIENSLNSKELESRGKKRALMLLTHDWSGNRRTD